MTSRLLNRCALIVACVALPGVSSAEQASCSPGPCAGKDISISDTAYRRALIAADASNPSHLVVGSGESYDVCRSRMAVSISDDRGVTWRQSCMAEIEYFFPEESPTVGVDTQGRLLAVAAYRFEAGGDLDLKMQVSADNGQTWGEPSTVAFSRYFRGWLTDAHVDVDTGARSKHHGNLYVAYADTGSWDPYAQVAVASSKDGGLSWHRAGASPEYGGKQPGRPSAPDLAIGRNGTLYLSYLLCPSQEGCDDEPSQVMLVTSAQGSGHWSEPKFIQPVRMAPARSGGTPTLPNTKATLAYRPVLAVDASKGIYRDRLYSVVSSQVDGRLQTLISTSADGGASWSAPQPVAGVAGAYDQFAPSVAVSERGMLAVSWLDRRNDPENVKYQPMVAFSDDGGSSFSAPVLLDTRPSDPSKTYNASDLADSVWAGGRLVSAFIGAGTGGAKGRLTLRFAGSRP